MADPAADPKQNPPADPSKTDPEPPDAEKAFWGKFDDRLDAWFERKLKDVRGTGDQRTGGRTTLSGVLADLMFGKK